MRFEIGEIMKQNLVMDLVYGNSSCPKKLLGRHYVRGGQVIAAYHPDAVSMRVITDDGEIYEMDSVERLSVFALFIPGQNSFSYQIEMTFQDGNTFTNYNPYDFPCQITKREEEDFQKGCWLNSYKKLGCHPMEINGVKGLYFAVWAPSAKRVSVVGNFNFWNGLIYPMNRLEKSGIYEIFLPNAQLNQYYKYEIKTTQGYILQKADPYGMCQERTIENASKTFDMSEFHWDDKIWMKNRKYKNVKETPMVVYSFSEKEMEKKESILEEDFTHILFNRKREQWGIKEDWEQWNMKEAREHPTTFFTPSFCYGSPDLFRQYINETHRKGIGVIMEISPGYFSRESAGLERFDGTMLYGTAVERIRPNEESAMCRFFFERPEVSNYLLSNLLFWIREYHIDGFVFGGITDIISTNKNTSNNLNIKGAAIGKTNETMGETGRAFLTRAVETIRKEDPGVIVISDEYAELSSKDKNLFLGEADFDFYWNYSVKENLNSYLSGDKLQKMQEHYKITLPLQKAGLSRSLLLLNYKKQAVFRQTSIDNPLSDGYDMLSEAKISYAFLMGVPGKKVLSEIYDNSEIRNYLHSLIRIYREYPALYEYEKDMKSFEWVNGMDAVSSVVSFIRKSSSSRNQLLFICNFSSDSIADYQVGVPHFGKYVLLSNSDATEFGGEGRFVEQSPAVMREPCDFRPYSIEVSLPPNAALIFGFGSAFDERKGV